MSGLPPQPNRTRRAYFYGPIVASLLFGCEPAKQIAPHPPEFKGIGLELEETPEAIVVRKVFESGPAHLAGVKSKDRLVSINGIPCKTLNFAEVIAQLRGENRSKLALTVDRGGSVHYFILKRTSMVRAGDAYLPKPSPEENVGEK